MTVNELAIAAKTDSEYIKPLWLAVYRLITLWANKRIIAANDPRYDADDLTQAGYFALIRAVEQYPADSPYKFTTYLHYHCRSEFNQVAGIRSSKREPYLYSLDKPLTDDGDYTLVDTLEDTDSTEEINNTTDRIYNEQLHNTLETALDSLPERSRYVLKAHFYEDKTYKDMADYLGVTATYPRQLVVDALRQLRRGKIIRMLKDFDYDRYSVRHSGYASFRYNMESSVETIAMKKLELEERLKQMEREHDEMKQLLATAYKGDKHPLNY